MSSFIFEKEHINLGCFGTSHLNSPRIFRSTSQYFVNSCHKTIDQTSLKFQALKTNSKKKSLKKQKPSQHTFSRKYSVNQNKIVHQINAPEIQSKNTIKQPEFEPLANKKIPLAKNYILKAPHNPTVVKLPLTLISEHFIVPPLSVRIPNQSQNQHIKASCSQEQYDKFIEQEFRKDIVEFEKKMNIKISQKKIFQHEIPQKPQNCVQKNQIFCKINIDREQNIENNFKTQSFSAKQNYEHQKQIFNQKLAINQIFNKEESQFDQKNQLKLIFDHKKIQKSFHRLSQKPLKKQRKQSFSSSTIMYRQKQTHLKKQKNRVYPKQIESEKDGSSQAESDKLSEVIGRGWDGLTECKKDLEELEDLIKKESNQSQTMITQQSHIKNSQIKTSEFSNSLISPKSLYQRRATQGSAAFGCGKYVMRGISYKHIDDLQKVKNSAYEKIQF